jgi:hypothetical protein
VDVAVVVLAADALDGAGDERASLPDLEPVGVVYARERVAAAAVRRDGRRGCAAQAAPGRQEDDDRKEKEQPTPHLPRVPFAASRAQRPRVSFYREGARRWAFVDVFGNPTPEPRGPLPPTPR